MRFPPPAARAPTQTRLADELDREVDDVSVAPRSLLGAISTDVDSRLEVVALLGVLAVSPKGTRRSSHRFSPGRCRRIRDPPGTCAAVGSGECIHIPY